MTENSGKVELPEDKNNDKFICTCVYTVANVLQVASSDEKVYKFASKTLSEGVLALVSISVKENTANLIVNCEKMVIGTMLLKDLKRVLSKSWNREYVGEFNLWNEIDICDKMTCISSIQIFAMRD